MGVDQGERGVVGERVRRAKRRLRRRCRLGRAHGESVQARCGNDTSGSAPTAHALWCHLVTRAIQLRRAPSPPLTAESRPPNRSVAFAPRRNCTGVATLGFAVARERACSPEAASRGAHRVGRDLSSLPPRIWIAHRARLALKSARGSRCARGSGLPRSPQAARQAAPASTPGPSPRSLRRSQPTVSPGSTGRGSPGVDHPGSLPGSIRLGRS